MQYGSLNCLKGLQNDRQKLRGMMAILRQTSLCKSVSKTILFWCEKKSQSFCLSFGYFSEFLSPSLRVSVGSCESACVAGIESPFWDRHSSSAGGSESEPRHPYPSCLIEKKGFGATCRCENQDHCLTDRYFKIIFLRISRYPWIFMCIYKNISIESKYLVSFTSHWVPKTIQGGAIRPLFRLRKSWSLGFTMTQPLHQGMKLKGNSNVESENWQPLFQIESMSAIFSVCLDEGAESSIIQERNLRPLVSAT